MSLINTKFIPLGYALTIVTDEFSAGIYERLDNPGGSFYSPDVLDVNTTLVLGPFNEPRNYKISLDGNDAAYSLDYSGVFTAEDEPGSFTEEEVADIVGSMVTGNTETGIAVTYQDADNTLDFAISDEYVQDLVGAMFTGNTETGITVDYQDSDGTIDVVLVNPSLTNAGVVNTGSTAVESGEAIHHKTTLTVNSTLPAIAGGADLSVGKLLYTFPAGSIVVNAAYMSMGITQTDGNINADTPDVGIGTTIGSGANALLSDVGAGSENILTGQTANNCTGTAEVKTVADQVLVIEAGDDHTVYFNVADGWAASGDAAAIIAGTVVLDWTFIK